MTPLDWAANRKYSKAVVEAILGAWADAAKAKDNVRRRARPPLVAPSLPCHDDGSSAPEEGPTAPHLGGYAPAVQGRLRAFLGPPEHFSYQIEALGLKNPPQITKVHECLIPATFFL